MPPEPPSGPDLASQLQVVLQRIENERNRAAIGRYLKERRARGRDEKTVLNLARHLADFAAYVGDTILEPEPQTGRAKRAGGPCLSTEHLTEWAGSRTVARPGGVRKLADSTWIEKQKAVKALLVWLHDKRGVTVPDHDVLATHRRLKRPTWIPSPSDVAAILREARCARDRAVLALMSEGLRRGEVRSLRLSSVVIEPDGMVVVVEDGKTGSRRVALPKTVRQYVDAWLFEHPARRGGGHADAELFVHTDAERAGRPVSYHALYFIVKSAGRRAGLPARFQPHDLRRFSITTKIRRGWNHHMLERHHGWVVGSDVIPCYSAATSEDYVRWVREVDEGQAPPAERPGQPIAPLRCPACGAENEPHLAFCRGCAGPLNSEARRIVAAQQGLHQAEIAQLAVESVQKQVEAFLLAQAATLQALVDRVMVVSNLEPVPPHITGAQLEAEGTRVLMERRARQART